MSKLGTAENPVWVPSQLAKARTWEQERGIRPYWTWWEVDQATAVDHDLGDTYEGETVYQITNAHGQHFIQTVIWR